MFFFTNLMLLTFDVQHPASIWWFCWTQLVTNFLHIIGMNEVINLLIYPSTLWNKYARQDSYYHTHTHTHTHTHAYMHTCMHTHAYTRMHACIHMHTHTHTHVHTQDIIPLNLDINWLNKIEVISHLRLVKHRGNRVRHIQYNCCLTVHHKQEAISCLWG